MITESRLLPNLSRMSKYSARDVADLAFGYMLALHLCRQEFETASWAKTYAQQTSDSQGFAHTNLNKPDLHQLLNVLVHKPNAWLTYMKHAQASDLLMKEIDLDVHVVHRFLTNVRNIRFDPELSGRLLLQIERALKITTSNYKSMRRILTDWHLDHVDTEAKRLVMTRLLQMLRAKAQMGDVYPKLDRLARDRKWEIHHACDPETGRNCDAGINPPLSKKPSIMKQLAIGAGLGVGAYLLGKALFGGNQK